MGSCAPPKLILFFINEETNDSHQLFFARFKRKLSCFENQGKCPLSAIVTRTSRSTVYTCAFWIATKENQQVTAQVGQRFLGYLPSGKPGCGCERIIVFGLSGFITVTRACARDDDGKVRANTGIGVDKNWPSINAYTALGFKVYVFDFHGVKAFDKSLRAHRTHERGMLSAWFSFEASQMRPRHNICAQCLVARLRGAVDGLGS